ncbi:MAG TPA: alpha/beta hydrolase [Gemmatimonadales bacterium]
MERTVAVNGIGLHVLDHPGGPPVLVLLHGLSANAHHFDGLVAAGLVPRCRAVAPDLRGRGLSDKPVTGYAMADHAADVLGLLDQLGLERVVLGGHSFGALLTVYLAVHAPARVTKLIMLDGAASMHPEVRALIAPSLARLGEVYPSEAAYLERIRAMPFLRGYWSPELEGAFHAELEPHPDGRVSVRTSAAAIAEALDHVLAEPWEELVARVEQPTLLVRAPEGYGPPVAPPILREADARGTVDRMRNARYVETTGNHLTMLFGEHAPTTVKAILGFVEEALPGVVSAT